MTDEQGIVLYCSIILLWISFSIVFVKELQYKKKVQEFEMQGATIDYMEVKNGDTIYHYKPYER